MPEFRFPLSKGGGIATAVAMPPGGLSCKFTKAPPQSNVIDIPAGSLLGLPAWQDNPRAFGASPFIKGELGRYRYPTGSTHDRTCMRPKLYSPCGNPHTLSLKSRAPSRAGLVWQPGRDTFRIHPWRSGGHRVRRTQNRAADRPASMQSACSSWHARTATERQAWNCRCSDGNSCNPRSEEFRLARRPPLGGRLCIPAPIRHGACG